MVVGARHLGFAQHFKLLAVVKDINGVVAVECFAALDHDIAGAQRVDGPAGGLEIVDGFQRAEAGHDAGFKQIGGGHRGAGQQMLADGVGGIGEKNSLHSLR